MSCGAARVCEAPGVRDASHRTHLRHVARRDREQLELVVGVVRARVRDIVEDVLAVEPVPEVERGEVRGERSGRAPGGAAPCCSSRRSPLLLGDLDEALGAEGALGVNVHRLALRAALLHR